LHFKYLGFKNSSVPEKLLKASPAERRIRWGNCKGIKTKLMEMNGILPILNFITLFIKIRKINLQLGKI
jgi:hypothetical protein